MDRKIRKLGSLDTKAVALVGRGANRKRIAFSKAEDTMNLSKLLVDVIEKGEMDDEGEFEKACKAAGLDDGRTQAAKGIFKLMGAYKDDDAYKSFLKAHLGKMFGQDEPDEDEDDMSEETKKAEELAKQQAADATKAAADAAVKAETVSKAEFDSKVQDEVKKQLEGVMKAQEAVIKGLQDQVKKSDDDRRMASWITKAEKDLLFVPGQTTEQLAKMLYDLESMPGNGAALAEANFKVLKATSDGNKAITKARGYSGESPFQPTGQEDSFQEIMKAAQPQVAGLVEVVKNYDGIKGTRTRADRITKAAEYEAVSEYILAHPEMYDNYLSEHPEQTTSGPSRRN